MYRFAKIDKIEENTRIGGGRGKESPGWNVEPQAGKSMKLTIFP